MPRRGDGWDAMMAATAVCQTRNDSVIFCLSLSPHLVPSCPALPCPVLCTCLPHPLHPPPPPLSLPDGRHGQHPRRERAHVHGAAPHHRGLHHGGGEAAGRPAPQRARGDKVRREGKDGVEGGGDSVRCCIVSFCLRCPSSFSFNPAE